MFRNGVLTLAALLLIGAVVAAVGGGFDIRVLGSHVSVHDPLRLFWWSSAAMAMFVIAHGVEPTWRATRRLASRISTNAVAGAVALLVMGTGVLLTTGVAGDTESYGYVSQADFPRTVGLKVPQPWVARVPWPNAGSTFAPVAYRPIDDEGVWAMIPEVPVGVPLAMATAKSVAGHRAMFWIGPLSAGLLVWMTFLLGRRLGSPGAGLIAACLIATSPALLHSMMSPSAAVPVAALLAIPLVLLLSDAPIGALGAGALASMAILCRPEIIPIVAIMAGTAGTAGTLGTQVRGYTGTRVRRYALRGLFFAAGALQGLIAAAAIHLSLYREIAIPTYHGLGAFAWSNVGANLIRVLRWMIETQTVFFIIGLVAVLVPLRRWWPFVTRRAVFVTFAAAAAIGAVIYGGHPQVDERFQLRELLVAWPMVTLGCGAVALAIIRASPPWGRLAVLWMLVAIGMWTLQTAAARGAFGRWRTEGRQAAIATEVRALTGEGSVVYSMMHSGTLSYYGGRTTIRYDSLDPAWLDRSVEWLAKQGVHAYALLDDWEVQQFRRRFAGQSVATRLDRSLVVRFQADVPAQLFDLQREQSPLMPIVVADTARFRFAPPVLADAPVFHAP